MTHSSNTGEHDATSGEEGNRRGDILCAAGRLFREKGYNGTTIRDIAAAVNMRSGSPFYHFKTKHDMLLAVVVEGMHSIHDAVVAAAARNTSPRARFAAMVQAHLQALLGPEGRDFAAVVIRECGALEPEAWQQVQAQKDGYEDLWKATLDELHAAGELSGDMHLTRLLILGAMNWATQWYQPEGTQDCAAIAAQLCRLILKD